MGLIKGGGRGNCIIENENSIKIYNENKYIFS